MIDQPSTTPSASRQHRKSTGAYYTPAPLIDLLLDRALMPLIAQRATGKSQLTILDPACGPGDFLIAARDRLQHHPQPTELHGIDLDPNAIAAARASLPSSHLPFDICHLTWTLTNALLSPPAALQPHSIDLVLGNPPFVNAIEKYLTADTKLLLRQRFPEVTGAADLSCYFLAQAIRLVRPGGRIAFVLPRALLNSPTAAGLRAHLPPHLRPNLIYAPDRHDFFPGAAIFICCLILGPADHCLLSADPDPATAHFIPSPLPETSNWWQHLHQHTQSPSAILHPPSSSSTSSLRHHFHAQSSLTAGDAYDLLPYLFDSQSGPGQKLLTTGLIDPRESLWGRVSCRFLKRQFQFPRVRPDAPLTESLAHRLAQSRRPKIIIAGLAKRFEAILDEAGEYLGAVSTFSVFDPEDDLPSLLALLDHLHCPAMTDHLISQLAANALRGRHITLKKSFLLDLPLPPEWPAADGSPPHPAPQSTVAFPD